VLPFRCFDGFATALPRTRCTCCDDGATGGHGAEAATRAPAVSDTQAVQRDGGTGGRLRLVCMDTRREGQRRESAHASAEIGGQAVVGCFQTVGMAVAEAEANLPTVEERHARKALKMWVDLHSMPSTHPLAQMIRRRTYKRFTSPMHKIAESARGVPMDDLEATQPYISAPQDARLDMVNDVADGAQAATWAQETQGIRIATSASARNRFWLASVAPSRALTG
jgi:hypothetical protein